MLIPVRSAQFRRDVKRMEKRGKDLGKLRNMLGLLIGEHELPPIYKDHPPKGDWKGYRDAHIGLAFDLSSGKWRAAACTNRLPFGSLQRVRP